MVSDTPNIDAHLLPERSAQQDLFICDVADAILKDIMPQMEHPFYALSKKPETNVRRYEHNGNWLEIVPSVKGLATIYDKDILVYAISQVFAKLKNNESVSKRVRINAHDLLLFTKRGTAGKDYKALCEALDRLDGTRIRTNIRREGEEQFNTFGLIEASTVARKFGIDGRLLYCEVVLSDWVFDAIRNQQALTLHPDYFRLRKPLERRTYELARKHCGQQSTWRCSVEVLHKKSGSRSSVKQFRYLLKDIARTNHLPDYELAFGENDVVHFTNRNTMPLGHEIIPWAGYLEAEAHIQAKAVLQGHDSYAVESEWREFLSKNEISPKHPSRHFVKFCKSYVELRGAAR